MVWEEKITRVAVWNNMQSLEARDPLTGYWNNPSERR